MQKKYANFLIILKAPKVLFQAFFFYTDTPTQQQTHILDTLVSNVISPPQQLN